MSESFGPLVVRNDNSLHHASLADTSRSDDLAVMSKWVRYDLFRQVKFVYKPQKDLDVNGMLFKLFEYKCAKSLAGLKYYTGNDPEYRSLYLKSLWNEATQKKNNLIMDSLNARRSCIYSAILNRFNGKYVL